ncbi:uncharacterized protein [Triticum aestivum]|uniref:uncharacterized protein n=1 Tax=Triticum aestivum TaxID=4565 RepID=UPI001D035CF6|nr:uncharacterized protein LOC123097052 [Triticum aestivum]
MDKRLFDGERIYARGDYLKTHQRTSHLFPSAYAFQPPDLQDGCVKQEEVDTANDTSGGQITHDEPLCRKHNKRYEYIHRPRKASSIQKFKGKKIHLKPGKYILRGEPCKHYLDEFSRHVVWGNIVRLYNHNGRALRKIIRSTTTPNNYYVCHMTETFATQGKRMYFNVHFSMGSLFPHMDAGHGELPITTGDGTTTVTARFIKGVDKRATITKGWSDFFRRTHMNEGQAYAFGFKCTSKGLHLIVYSI